MTIDEIWKKTKLEVAAHPPAIGEFKLYKIDIPNQFSFYAGVDSSADIVFGISVKSRPPAIPMRKGAFDYIRIPRHPDGYLMLLRLTAPNLQHVFGRLCQDLIEASYEVTTEPALITFFKDRLSLWIKLFMKMGNGLLQKNEIRGLMAELLILKDYICDRTSAGAEIVAAWTGPLGSDQDFVFQNQVVEVKCVNPSADLITISSPEQLESPLPMTLTIVMLRESTPDERLSFNLIKLCGEIEELLASYPDALSMFRDRMLESGYVEDEYYNSICCSLIEKTHYEVATDFPRVRRADLPKGIANLSYGLMISAIEKYKT